MCNFAAFYDPKMEIQLAFWDKTQPIDTLIIATHGFVKKTQKTPQKEINKALSIRDLYFRSKQKQEE